MKTRVECVVSNTSSCFSHRWCVKSFIQCLAHKLNWFTCLQWHVFFSCWGIWAVCFCEDWVRVRLKVRFRVDLERPNERWQTSTAGIKTKTAHVALLYSETPAEPFHFSRAVISVLRSLVCCGCLQLSLDLFLIVCSLFCCSRALCAHEGCEGRERENETRREGEWHSSLWV